GFWRRGAATAATVVASPAGAPAAARAGTGDLFDGAGERLDRERRLALPSHGFGAVAGLQRDFTPAALPVRGRQHRIEVEKRALPQPAHQPVAVDRAEPLTVQLD